MLSLNGKWKVTHVPYCSPIDFILSPSFVPEGWLDAAVPEEIHRTLRNAGIIRGNVYGKTERKSFGLSRPTGSIIRNSLSPQRKRDGRFC